MIFRLLSVWWVPYDPFPEGSFNSCLQLWGLKVWALTLAARARVPRCSLGEPEVFFCSGTCWGRLCWCLRCHYTTNFRGIEQYTCMVILSFSSCDSALFRLVIHWPLCFFSFLCEVVFSSGVCLYVDVSKLRFRVMCWCMFDVSEKMIFFRGFRWCNAKVYLSKKIAIPHQLALQAFSSVDLFHVDQDGTWG